MYGVSFGHDEMFWNWTLVMVSLVNTENHCIMHSENLKFYHKIEFYGK